MNERENPTKPASKMMMIANSNNNNKTKINDLPQTQINKLVKLMQDDWRDVIHNLPSIQTGYFQGNKIINYIFNLFPLQENSASS